MDIILDLPPKNRSIVKLENFILWIKGDSNEQTAMSRHKHTAKEIISKL
jgi:hypothetical protein